jgi:hypothetical protein
LLPEWPNIIGLSAVPVVIISACGLLSLAFYGRLAAVVARLRSFQREMLEEQEKIHQSVGAEHLEQHRLVEMLRIQTLQVTRRARLIRMALLFFLVAVALLIACSLALAFSWFAREAAFLAAILFVFGLLSMLAGVVAAMLELRGALQPVELEARFVSDTIIPPEDEGRREAEEPNPEEEQSTVSRKR